jgi:hypothetical protein
MYSGLNEITRHSCQSLIDPEYSGQIFEIYSNIRFHENPSSGRRLVPGGQTEGWAVMTKLIVAFRSFANRSDKESKCRTDLSIRRDHHSCQPHFVNPRAKMCHVFVAGDFRRGCQTCCFNVFLRPSSRCRH